MKIIVFLVYALGMISCQNLNTTTTDKSLDKFSDHKAVGNPNVDDPSKIPHEQPETVGTQIQQGQSTPPVNTESPYKGMKIKRRIGGKEVELTLSGYDEGYGFNVLYQEILKGYVWEKMDRVLEYAPGVLVYEEFPKELAKDFHFIAQPMKVEFIDEQGNTISEYAIFKNTPYGPEAGLHFSYFNFNAEDMQAVPYSKQEGKKEPDEISLFTNVSVSGKHITINYQLRSLSESAYIIGVKNTVRILDGQGRIVSELKDLTSFDGGAVSEDGKYMLYVFGGDMGNADQPFVTMEEPGWAIVDLASKKTLFAEYKKPNFALNRVWLDQNFLRVSYSTPYDKATYGDYIFFNPTEKIIYRKFFTQEQWANLIGEWQTTNKSDWQYYIVKFNFEAIVL